MLKIKYFLQQSWLLITASFCFGLLVAGANAAWQGRIIQNEENKFNSLVEQMLPGSRGFEMVLEEVTVESGKGKAKLTSVKKALNSDGTCAGWAFISEGSGFADKIKLILAVDANFEKLQGYGVLSSNETPGFGDQIKLSYYRNQFVGVPVDELSLSKTGDPELIDSQIVAISGATVSSQAVVDIINLFLRQVKNEMQEKGLIDNGG